MKNIILLAPPASGKGTQASLLKKDFDLVHISTGDLLRSAASRNDDLGIKLKEIMSSGTLVSDDIVISLLKEKLVENRNSNGFIFDGFPRTVNQAIELDKLLNELEMNIDYVFLMEADYDILLKRITGRRSCPKCGKIYNIYTDLKPVREDICDVCFEHLVSRSDDNPDSFKIRYQEYLAKTYPLIDYYEEHGKLIRINALDSIEKVYDKILSVMK